MFHRHKGPRQAGSTTFLFLAAFLLAVGTAGLSAQTTPDAEDEDQSALQGSIRVDHADLEALAKIGSEEAKEKALTALRGATVEEVELEIADGYLVYDVEILLGTEKLELELVVDAGDGKVLAVEVDAEDDEDAEDNDR